MDKRIIKTQDAIFNAFAVLINNKDYDDITIQDIIDESNIGRSTFYMHFKTKDELLSKISENIFNHVFSQTLTEEKSHDFSKSNIFDYKHLITHTLYHIRDEKDLIKGIMSSKGNDVFLKSFKAYLRNLADSYFNNYRYSDNIPLELKKELLIDNFIVLIRYWINDGFMETPEKLTDYFVSLI